MNPWNQSAPAPSAAPWKRVRGFGAGLAAVAFFGTVVIAPFAVSTASSADELASPEELNQRINQEFVAADVPDVEFAFESSSEKLPDPKPKPKPAPETDEDDASDSEETADADGGDASAEPESPEYTGGGSPKKWMTEAGIAESDFAYVDYIANRESGWNPNATNASSGACGVIQANPCSKVPGNGYNPVDNLKWADGYAKDRYGSWQAAYAFWTANHWW